MSSSSTPAAFRLAELILKLPPGYHFLRTDDKLVVHYMHPRLTNADHHLPLPIFVYERILNYRPDRLIAFSPTQLVLNAFSPTQLVLNLPPGYHFLPTDDELVIYYLRPRLANADHHLPLPIFVYERILNYRPDELIKKYMNYGEGRWFFFTERERKHSGGNRPNRTTPDNSHWNATGSIRPIRSAGGVLVGCRRTLVFYEASRSRKKKNQPGLPAVEEEGDGDGGQAAAKAKDGVKTEWTMYEYESLDSEAEFEAIRSGSNANKMDVLLLCTIQKKKHSQEGGETKKEKKKKKSARRKTKEAGLELEAVPAAAGDVDHGSRAGTTEGQEQDENHVQRTLMESSAAEPLPELACHAPAAMDNFNVDSDQNMPYYYLANSLSPMPVPTPSQETPMAPASGDNHILMYQQNYFFINHSMNMKNSQSFHLAQATAPQEFLPYLDAKMAAPLGGGNTMDHMLQNRFVNMTPSQAPQLLLLGTDTCLSPRRSKSDVWERSAELPGDKPNMPLKSEDDAWWSSHCQAKLPGRELNSNSPSVSSSLPFVPTPQQETVMALAARGHNHTAMHQRNYFSHSMDMRNSQFHVQATLPQQEEFLPYSGTKMAAPLGGRDVVDHRMLQNRIVNNMTPAAATEAQTFNGFYPGLSNYAHLSTRMDHPAGPSSVPFPSQQSDGAGGRTGMQGSLLNNQVNLINHQNPVAASMVGYDQWNGVGFSTQDL